MKKSSILIAISLTAIMFLACGAGGTKGQAKKETPKALQEKGFTDISSYDNYDKRGYFDLVEELYKELVEKTPKLKALEDEIDQSRKEMDVLEKDYHIYDGKSTHYYRSAEGKANSIGDTVLRAKINDLIKKSADTYAYKTKEINALIGELNKNQVSVYEHQLAMKIVLTLPLIEDYQKDNLPANNGMKDLIKKQEGLIKKTGNEL